MRGVEGRATYEIEEFKKYVTVDLSEKGTN